MSKYTKICYEDSLAFSLPSLNEGRRCNEPIGRTFIVDPFPSGSWTPKERSSEARILTKTSMPKSRPDQTKDFVAESSALQDCCVLQS